MGLLELSAAKSINLSHIWRTIILGIPCKVVSCIMAAKKSVARPLAQKRKGAQIDLLIDRKDFVINICEMKYAESPFVIDKGYAAELENKKDVFKNETGTKKSLFLTLITSFGVKENNYSIKLLQNAITMDVLFDH